MQKHLVPVNYAAGTSGNVVASGLLLVPPRVAADARKEGGGRVRVGVGWGAPEGRREGGTRERRKGARKLLWLLVARQQEFWWGFPREGNRRRGGRGGSAEGKPVSAWRNGVIGAFFRDLLEKVQV